ncbi:MAG: aminotransferase class V-fold PLP-dependent enzyme [Nanoarchaeota archaeon]|nr:aminotransferase class V-fold PLP-dependent enzyme [Nanoarchaeota archaeon]
MYFPQKSTDHKQLFNELSNLLDSGFNPVMNLGTYSNPYMEADAFDLMKKVINKNLVDCRIYAGLSRIKTELIGMLGSLFNLDNPYGEVTSGSSEAVFISLLAHKLKWAEEHGNMARPNLIVGVNAHNCFDKFARFFDVEIRKVPLGMDLAMDASSVEARVDKNTFCIVGTACSSEAGAMDDIIKLDRIAARHHIPLHVDAASGGFFLPFADMSAEFDFRLSSVMSMNISGHKFGLVFPGIGIVIIRPEAMPSSLTSEIGYLSGGSSKHINLLCTQNSAFMVGLYYNLRRFGHDGYSSIMHSLMVNKGFLIEKLIGLGLEIVDSRFPVFLIRSNTVDLSQLSHNLKIKGWVQNPYIITGTDHEVIRVVIKLGMDKPLLERLVTDVKESLNLCSHKDILKEAECA